MGQVVIVGGGPVGVALAVDRDGKARVAYWVAPEEGANYSVLVWSPESGHTAVAADSNGQTPDVSNLSLAIANGKIHLLLSCPRDEKDGDPHGDS